MIRSSLRNIVIACAVLGPAELSSQAWRTSWLDYNGTIDGSFKATCPNNNNTSTPVPRAGKLRFNFYLSGNDAKTNFTSEWYTGPGNPRISTSDLIDASGNASSSEKFYFLEGGSINWEGRFSRGSDGSVQASGTISPRPGDEFGCTGTWSAGVAAAATTNKAACAERLASIERFWSQTALPFERENRTVFPDRTAARDLLYQTNRTIQGIKSMTRSGSIEEQEQIRRNTWARINKLNAVVKQIEAHSDEMRRMWTEARAAGCSLPDVPTRTGADKAIDEILALDAPKAPSSGPSDRNVGVADVKGQVEIRSEDGSRTTLTSGTRIGLNVGSITILTGPGSSVTIQEGSVRRTLQPNTTIRVFPSGSFKADVVERGSLTIQVRDRRPYQIEAGAATASVDGTVFTVSYDATIGVTGITVEEGRVTVQPRNPGVRAVALAPGEYVEVTRNAMTAVLPAPGAPETRGVTSAGPDTRRNPLGTTQSIDLTGLWQDDTGGGAIYRLRQVGNWLYWLVDGTPKGSYVNLSYGQISGNTITGLWVDMPGSPTLSGGNLTLRIESNDRLVKVGAGGYGAQAWIRVNSTGGNRQ